VTSRQKCLFSAQSTRNWLQNVSFENFLITDRYFNVPRDTGSNTVFGRNVGTLSLSHITVKESGYTILYSEELNQEPILNYIERRSIQWYGHVVRIQDYRKPKQAMETRREKRRSRGRPRKTWKDCEIDVARRKRKILADMKRLARDRIAFRQWIEDPTLQGNRDR
jgi:hypothetical protein